jgi:hypothetical protein
MIDRLTPRVDMALRDRVTFFPRVDVRHLVTVGMKKLREAGPVIRSDIAEAQCTARAFDE